MMLIIREFPEKTLKGFLRQILRPLPVGTVITAVLQNLRIVLPHEGIHCLFIAVFHFPDQKKILLHKNFSPTIIETGRPRKRFLLCITD